MRRPRLLLVALVGALATTASAGAAPPVSWADSEIRLVVARGVMGPTAAAFRPDDALTEAELVDLAGRLVAPRASAPSRSPAAATMVGLNARLVRTLGLHDAATRFSEAAAAAGIAPTSRFGTEVVARLLGLRKNHPAAQDALERLPNQPASRAEAAYSAARILRFTGAEVTRARAAAATFAPAPLGPWQRRILQTAFSFVGFPYVWGGESETTNGPLGPQLQGGFDCSGFVWRVYKLQPYGDGGRLAATLRGRTTYAMSSEVPVSARIPFERLSAGDLVFFGAKGPLSKPAQVDHMGIYVGRGWIVHSSRDGVTLAPFDGWYRDRFAWGRRPLAEAGLVAPTSR